jgi:tetratricopeptide (TPR) repeat protein
LRNDCQAQSNPRARASSSVFKCALLGLLAMLVGGCATSDQQAAQQAVADYYMGDYANARTLLEPLAKKTNEDFVLNNCRLGSTVLAQNDLPESEAAFLRAYEVINSVGVNNGGRSLGAALVDEKIKVWKGEPFERAMANFYLGLIYYKEADYNNARAAFENALFKLRDYSSEDDKKSDQYREIDSNFILAQYMLARSFQRLGQDDLAHANFQRVAQLRPDLPALADYDLNQKSNVLLVVDFGYGPQKVTNGDGALVGFAPLPRQVGPPPHPTIIVDGQVASAPDAPLVDLIVLAQDRRWQDIDTIRAVKSAVGTGLIAGGAYETLAGRRQTDMEVGLGLMAAGLLLKATSQADTRIWEMLPRSTYAIPLTLPPGNHVVSVQFAGRSGTAPQTVNVDVPGSGETTSYVRMQ